MTSLEEKTQEERGQERGLKIKHEYHEAGYVEISPRVLSPGERRHKRKSLRNQVGAAWGGRQLTHH